MKRKKPNFRVGQIVVITVSNSKRPFRIQTRRWLLGSFWYIELSGHDWREDELRQQTKREAGR